MFDKNDYSGAGGSASQGERYAGFEADGISRVCIMRFLCAVMGLPDGYHKKTDEVTAANERHD